MPALTVPVISANICCLPRRNQLSVRRRVRRALSTAPGPVFFQEIEIPRYTRCVRVQSAKHGRRPFGLGHEVPIAMPLSWQVDHATNHRVHGGLHGVSPSRVVDEVLCDDVAGFQLAFLACHPVSKPEHGVNHAAWRIQHWAVYHAFLVQRIAELHAQGYTVFVGGDMNKTDVPTLHAAQHAIAHSGLDHLWVVPAPGVSVTRIRTARPIKRTRLMDHPIITGTVDLEAA